MDDADPAKQGVAGRLVHEAHLHQSAVISFQVVQETLHVLSRKFRVVANPVDTRDFLRNVLAPLWRVQPSAALEAGCARLLSEDLQHGQLIEGLTIENPFRA